MFLVDIPPQFNSDAEGEPFRYCKICEEELAGKDTYFIEKSVRQNPDGSYITFFEYALCFDCAKKTSNELSIESRENMKNFMTSSHNQITQNPEWIPEESSEENMNHILKKCGFSGNPIEVGSEHILYGMFQSNHLIVGPYPMVMNAEVMEDLQEVLSQATKDFLDDFSKELTGVPPEFEDLFKPKPVLIW